MSSKRIDQLSQQITLADLIADHRLLVQNTDTGEAAGVSGIEALSQLGEHTLGSWAFREDATEVNLPSGATSVQLSSEQERASLLVFFGTPADGCEVIFNNERYGPWTVLSATNNEATLVLKGEPADEGVELVSSFQWFLDPSNPFYTRSIINNAPANAILDAFAEGAYNDVQMQGSGPILREDGDASKLTNLPIYPDGILAIKTSGAGANSDEGLLVLDRNFRLKNGINTGTNIRVMRVSPDGKMVAVNRGQSSFVDVYSTRTLELLAELPLGGGFASQGIAWSPDSKKIVITGTSETDAHIFDAEDFEADPITFAVDVGTGASPLAWSPNGSFIAAGGGDGVKLFNADTQAELTTSYTSNRVDALAFSRNSQMLAATRPLTSSGLDVYRTSTPRESIGATIPNIGNGANGVVWTPGDKYLVVSGTSQNGDWTLLRNTGMSGTWENIDVPEVGTTDGVDVSSDGQLIALAGVSSPYIHVFNIETANRVANVFDARDFVRQVQFLPSQLADNTPTWGSAGPDVTPLTQSDAQSGSSLLTREEGEASAMTGIPRAVPVEYTDHHTLVAGDAGRELLMNVGSANNLTVPAESSLDFPLGTVIYVTQTGSGSTTLVADTGVTIETPDSLTLTAQWNSFRLRKIGSDMWLANEV